LQYHWHMNITRSNNNKDTQWVNSWHKHCITSQARGVGGSHWLCRWTWWSGDDSCGSGLWCWYDSNNGLLARQASECQQKKASVIVDGMGFSGGWKTTAAATKHSIHSTSLQDRLLTPCTTETQKQPIEPQATSSSRTSRRNVAIPLTHEHHMEQQQEE
jgi:hypothetical protein